VCFVATFLGCLPCTGGQPRSDCVPASVSIVFVHSRLTQVTGHNQTGLTTTPYNVHALSMQVCSLERQSDCPVWLQLLKHCGQFSECQPLIFEGLGQLSCWSSSSTARSRSSRLQHSNSRLLSYRRSWPPPGHILLLLLPPPPLRLLLLQQLLLLLLLLLLRLESCVGACRPLRDRCSSCCKPCCTLGVDVLAFQVQVGLEHALCDQQGACGHYRLLRRLPWLEMHSMLLVVLPAV